MESPIEDLMREHGLLNRILLIYEEIINRLQDDISFDKQNIIDCTYIIRVFIENHHEKTEENYIFPYLVKNNISKELIEELIREHNIGKKLTSLIFYYSNNYIATNKNNLIFYIKSYIKMYRFHETREDTVIFQQFKNILSKKEYLEYGELFEKEEKEKFGENGFEKFLKIVNDIEKELKIYDLTFVTNLIFKDYLI
jgi:hemerythrin-like domain-containing protein